METKLIESALWLTGKTLFEMSRWYMWEYEVEFHFCMAEFCYYLLSPEFIEKYAQIAIKEFYSWEYNWDYDENPITLSLWLLAESVYYYQSWNEQPLIDLLSKIK